MKDKAERMEKIVSLAAADEKRESVALGRSQQRLDEARERLGELENYRREYQRNKTPEGDVSAVRWADYQAFLARLDAAVKAQHQLILEGEQSVAAHRQRWMGRRLRLDSLSRVLDRYRQQARSDAERTEQRLLDDRHGSRAGRSGREVDRGD